MGIASSIGSAAAGVLGKKAKEFVFGGEAHTSWTDFYLAMAFDMESPSFVDEAIDAAISAGIDYTESFLSEENQKTINTVRDNSSFAKDLVNNYDKAVRGGKTIIGGMPVMLGNKPLMLLTLLSIMQAQSVSKSGDLLRDIGPAVQAYWTPGLLTVLQTPTIPCIGTIQNIQTIIGLNVTPGIWTPIQIPSMGSIDPFLLNFIASASLHLLTLTGIITCLAQYPPPAPPAPGVLPWIGYFVPPVALASGKNLPQILKNTLKKNIKAVIDTVSDPKTYIALGKDGVLVAIEESLKGNTKGNVNDLVAGVVTKVAGGLLEGGKLEANDVAQFEADVVASLKPTTKPTIDIASVPVISEKELGYTNAGG
jgi:hypothetical protein